MTKRIEATQGMLFHLVSQVRPELAAKVKETGRLKTAVVGLGGQGTKHAGLMLQYGSDVVAGVAKGKGGTRIHETIPVYDDVRSCLEDHPDLVAVSIWRHYTTARDSAIEVIEAGIPLVVLITEGIPLRDVRDILVAARRHNTLLIGGNTPGVIFPPEGIKIGMLPDVFYPQEVEPGVFGPEGVTIVSRSGAILYHMSDALASVGIAQNAVIGVGGDGAIGSPFRTIVPLAMTYPNTHLVVVAGEIGGIQEELLAEDIEAHPERYPKPIVALISGANAPEGKTMGHAGAIVAPGSDYGTYASKRRALEKAGVTVVNSQVDLIAAVQEKLGGRKYFEPERYYARMRKIWEAPAPKPTWGTRITKVQPNELLVAGYPLRELVGQVPLLAVSHLLIEGELPSDETLARLGEVAVSAAAEPLDEYPRHESEDVSKALARYLLMDAGLRDFAADDAHDKVSKAAYVLGRMARYLAALHGNGEAFASPEVIRSSTFDQVLLRALDGSGKVDEGRAKMLQALVVTAVDHGVTPPSAQATILAATVRAAFEVAVAHGVGAITDVHGGAGAKAARMFLAAAEQAKNQNMELRAALLAVMRDAIEQGRRIEGMGHRIHTKDPRRDVLWHLADETGVSGPCVAASKMAEEVFHEARGMRLPINVDGVMGAIVADLGLDPSLGKSVFIFGRVAGLAAHYFEEIETQPRMRRVNFAQAVYKGHPLRHLG